MREYAFQPLCAMRDPGFSSICRRIALIVPGMTWKRPVRPFVTSKTSSTAASAAAGIRMPRESRLLERGRPALLQQMDREAAEPPAEQRHRNRDECEVIPDGGRINACQADFEDESGQRDQKDRGTSEHWGYKL